MNRAAAQLLQDREDREDREVHERRWEEGFRIRNGEIEHVRWKVGKQDRERFQPGLQHPEDHIPANRQEVTSDRLRPTRGGISAC